MNFLAITIIIFGLLIIIVRAPLIVKPQETLDFYKKIINTNNKVRVLGIVIAMLGFLLIIASWNYNIIAAIILKAFGFIFLFAGSIFLLIFTKYYKNFGLYFLEKINLLSARILGLFALFLGAYFIYLGIIILI